MELNSLTAISPIDGRYRGKVSKLGDYFSEFALIKYRVKVEVEYFIALCEIPLPMLAHFDTTLFDDLRAIYLRLNENDATQIKTIEHTTNHDVKAVEYFLKQRFDEMKLHDFKEFIHFGLTSQDINNVALPLALNDAHREIIAPALNAIKEKLQSLAVQWKNVPLLARTHGQPASPTMLGKELYVFVERLNNQLALLGELPFSAKFGGATGNFNAHHVAFPNTDWVTFANSLITNKLGLHRQQTTSQIEHYDYLAAYCDNVRRINNILIDLSRDLWMYIMLDYFKQKIKAGEIGSSAMPHKVNPIDFENAEGNLGVANALLEHLSNKLPISRLQRDLTDSTVTRNMGVPLAHTWLSIQSMLKGLDKLLLNEEKIKADLQANWAVVAEAIQTILRREQIEGAYELLKDLTRTNEGINKHSIEKFILQLPVSETVRLEMLQLTPENYTGIDLLKHL